MQMILNDQKAMRPQTAQAHKMNSTKSNESATFERKQKPRDISDLDSLVFGYGAKEGDENIADDNSLEEKEEDKPKRKKWASNKRQQLLEVDESDEEVQ